MKVSDYIAIGRIGHYSPNKDTINGSCNLSFLSSVDLFISVRILFVKIAIKINKRLNKKPFRQVRRCPYAFALLAVKGYYIEG